MVVQLLIYVPSHSSLLEIQRQQIEQSAGILP